MSPQAFRRLVVSQKAFRRLVVSPKANPSASRIAGVPDVTTSLRNALALTPAYEHPAPHFFMKRTIISTTLSRRCVVYAFDFMSSLKISPKVCRFDTLKKLSAEIEA